MKKIVSRGIAAAALFFAANLNAQTFEVVGGNDQLFYPESSGSSDCKVHFDNKDTKDISLVYAKVSVDFPTAWSMTICDNLDCYSTFIDAGEFAPIATTDHSASMKLTVYPKGVADTAIVKYAFWDKANPSKKDTVTWYIYVRWGANTHQLETAVKMYPNPTNSLVNIESNSTIQSVQLFDLLGKNLPVTTQISEGGFAVVHLGNLVSGNYIISVNEAGVTKKSKITLVK